jgi:hypothetical protein
MHNCSEYLGAPGYVGDWSNLFGDNFEKAQIENKYYVSIIYALVGECAAFQMSACP